MNNRESKMCMQMFTFLYRRHCARFKTCFACSCALDGTRSFVFAKTHQVADQKLRFRLRLTYKAFDVYSQHENQIILYIEDSLTM